ncbi:MBL fold metallo-hydrolase [Gorillibacterium timonense]|uniref:MBL fold metallo-hydrolase n=1 Tax=Gorillibacterium timonense TaxID=1689269 RepID=UPI00071D8C5A|nr:MBL fold metallo-hydrolase [Gorillibacterium timonense]
MKAAVQLIRHATIRIWYGGQEVLLDPMLDDAGAQPPIHHTANALRNPLVTLPLAKSSLVRPDAVLVTHRHPDHWDLSAASSLDHAIPVYTQPGTEQAFRDEGFTSVIEVQASERIGEVLLSRTSGRHGTGEVGERMGPVSGFVLQAAGLPTVYVAGDTIWCEEVRTALDEFRPDWIVLNAGGARFLDGDVITMETEDVAKVARYAPKSRIIAVHMEAINHCHLTRNELREGLLQEGLTDRVIIPQDGETIDLL